MVVPIKMNNELGWGGVNSRWWPNEWRKRKNLGFSDGGRYQVPGYYLSKFKRMD